MSDIIQLFLNINHAQGFLDNWKFEIYIEYYVYLTIYWYIGLFMFPLRIND